MNVNEGKSAGTALSVENNLMLIQTAAMQLRLLFFAIGVFLFYLIVYYLLLTTNNPFNFNNNYHLIAFLTIIVSVVNISLFMLSASCSVVSRPRPVGDENGRVEAHLFYFVSNLLFLTLSLMPLVLYMMLLDDFAVKPRLLIVLGIGVGFFLYAYWGRWQLLIEKRGIVRKVLCLLLFALLGVFVLNILSGIIPTAIRSSGENVVLPL